nr:ATP-dependent Clp protease ATP-binding subunit [Pseudoclavibacter chungangensis]
MARYLQGQRQSRAGRPVDVSRLLSRRTHQVVESAANYAREHGHTEVDALHLLRVMIDHPLIREAVEREGGDPESLVQSVELALPASVPGTAPEESILTTSAQRALVDAYQLSRAFGSTYINPEHLFGALVLAEDTLPSRLLAGVGITPRSLQRSAEEAARAAQDPEAERPEASDSETPTLDEFGTDLTALAEAGELDPVIGRADEIAQTLEILARRRKNNPVLVGEAGVGKTAIVEGIARAIAADEVPEQLRGARIVSLELGSMLAGTRYRGDFEERLTKVVDEATAHADEIILFVDELHTVVGAGGSGEGGGVDAGNILKPRLARGELRLIGATTLDEYRRIEKDKALERRFQPVRVGEPGLEDAVRILHGMRDAYESHHGVRYTDEALRAAVELSDRYVTDRFLPDKAIDLIDQAGARLRLRRGPGTDTAKLRAELEHLESEKRAAVEAEDYEAASELRDRVANAQRALDEAIAVVSDDGDAVIDVAEIEAIIARATGIPAGRIGGDDRRRLAALESELHERVVGQDEAVRTIATAVRRSRAGMGDANRPVGSFLFLGPTGVGKTELAKALAESVFGDERALIRFDMSEFGERHTVSRLVGAPPGYVGYDEAGQLTERVRRNPYSVILLDEIEKAHPDVFNLLLQVLDDGRLTDGQGRTVDFRNTIVIMTSNLGSEFLASRGGALGFVANDATGFGSDKALRDRVMGKLREAMRPEFLNRIDEIVLFRKLEREQLRDIVRLLLRATSARLAEQGIGFEIDDAAVDLIVDHGHEPEFGARPLRRVIQRELDDRLAGLIVASELGDGDTAIVDVDGDTLRVVASRLRLAA